MRMLVTGGAGFIGSNFVNYWVKKYPHDFVTVIDKLTYAGNQANLKESENKRNYRFVKGDICDKETINSLMKETDILVHFAAETHVDRSIADPSAFVKTNVCGTYTLLDAALTHHIKRFHHISTDEVFGALTLDSHEKFSEETPYNPRSPYAASKAASDHFVRAYYTTYKLPITISNCSNNFGPYQYPEKLIPLAISCAAKNKRVPVYGDGLYVRDWIYVDDHVRTIDLILQKGTIGETYLIGGIEKDISNIDVVKRILKTMGKDEKLISHVTDRPGHDRRYAIDASKIKRELGWVPQHDFDTALKLTVDWYLAHPAWLS
ncbi:MAG TPA: dTDP-glucose 4,6-dehydratase [Patescibacteria group bacterium]|nr:dTDP-glucose 4,6-dehydratase [Patescibacteria group bacterium]